MHDKLVSLTHQLAKSNPAQTFFIDHNKAVAAAQHPTTGEIVPILSGGIDGKVYAYQGIATNGQAPAYNWSEVVA